MKNYLVYIFVLLAVRVSSQNISLNDLGKSPDASAMLDITSTTSGLLIPRMTMIQRDAIVNPATSLLIYQTNNTPGYYYNSGTTSAPVWQRLIVSNDNLGNHTATTNLILNNNYFSNDGDNEGIRIDNNGNVGIGVTAPNALLHLSRSLGTSGNDGAFIDVQNSSGIANSLSGLRFKNNSSTGNIRYQAAIFHRWTSATEYQLNFAVRDNNATDVVDTDDIVMTINDLGEVGIGTIDPSTPLHVEASQTASTFETNGIYLYNSSTSAGQHAFITARTQQTGGSPYFSLDINNQVGYSIGVSQANSTLDFYPFADGSGTPILSMDQNNRLGIGTVTPTEDVHIRRAGSAIFLMEADSDNSSGSDNPAIILQQDGGTVRGRIGFEGLSSTIFSNSIDDGMYMGTSSINSFQLITNNLARLTILPSGFTGVGTVAPSTTFHVNHPTGTTNGMSISNSIDADRWHWYVVSTNDLNLYFNGAIRGGFDETTGAYTSTSDFRLKKNIQPSENLLEKVKQLQIRQYHYKTQSESEEKTIGIIAQDLEKQFPSLVNHRNSDGEDTYLVDYSGLAPIAIKAIQEQQLLIEVLQQKIEALEKRLNEQNQSK